MSVFYDLLCVFLAAELFVFTWQPSPESTAISAHSTTPDHAYSTRSGCAFDDIPVASVWALTNSKAVPSSSREPVPTRPTGEELPGSTKLNGYPDRGSFVVNNLSSPTPRHISDEDFIQSSSSRAAVAQGQLNGHMVVYGRDPSTASSLLMSESVYLPLASTSLSPDQPPLGMEPTMSRSTPLCSLGPQNMMDPVRPSRNNTVMDSLDGTTSIPELESSRTTVRLSDQSRIPVDTLHSSNNSNQMNRYVNSTR
ncbi:hypothetical protein D915_011085 [Fasciola hepatica]|uniref:Uncharacterized protein n=1 Tax=Fasciola hepatica TaxID=6192 RepID=A0A4E0R863_FASHE|nr:hypothetical protein D915_011085 [Fasciola hepatica]